MKHKCDVISLVGVFATVILAVWNLISHLLLNEPVSTCTAFAVSVLFILVSLFLYRFRLPVGNFAVAGITIVIVACTNAFGFFSGVVYIVQLFVCLIVGIAGIILQIVEKQPVRSFPKGMGSALLACLVVFGGIWGGNTLAIKTKQNVAREIWAVPTKYDKADCPNKGKVEKLDYTTKAYATDGRTVQKSLYVYLPYAYDETKEYNILYLMHGTGDLEDYWLVKNEKNKIMLDNMIYHNEIKPLIVVTPTWYVENDCANDLDVLTYTFKDELRNDIMPAVEGKYATFAKTTTKEDFIASRDHRAFAGLSRGSSTTWHSVVNGSLDYFSWIGCYSGALTTMTEFEQGVWSEEFASYPIHYLYNTSGSFDFLLFEHLNVYRDFLEREKRLNEQNTSFDVFPMRYHSQGNWHIALYNTLQLFFK